MGVSADRRGGRSVLMLSHVVVATGLTALGFAPSPVNMFAGWAIIGFCMGAGLYELGPATLAVVYGAGAHGRITGISRIARFASKVG